RLVTVGGRITTKLATVVATPSAVFTVSRPVAAVGGIVIVTDVALTFDTTAVAVPTCTTGDTLPLDRLKPVSVTGVPRMPVVGVKSRIFGATRNALGDIPCPPGPTIVRRPVTA